MFKLEVAYSDDRKGIQFLRVTFPNGRTIPLTAFDYSPFLLEASKVVDKAILIERMVREIDWTKNPPHISDQR